MGHIPASTWNSLDWRAVNRFNTEQIRAIPPSIINQFNRAAVESFSWQKLQREFTDAQIQAIPITSDLTIFFSALGPRCNNLTDKQLYAITSKQMHERNNWRYAFANLKPERYNAWKQMQSKRNGF